LPASHLKEGNTLNGLSASPGIAFNRFASTNSGLIGSRAAGSFGSGRPVCYRCGIAPGFGIGRPWGYGGFWGGGLGFGYGLGWYDPFWFDPWYDPYWDGLDYGSSAYPPDYYYPPDDSGYQLYANPDAQANPSYNEQLPPPVSYGPGFAEPNVTPDSIPPNATGVIQLYLYGGAVVSATDYWFEGNKLHYMIGDAGEITISTDQLDLQRTVQENARRGLHFTMKTGPGNSSAAPVPNPAPSNSGGPGPQGGPVNHI
jgi:hypothetical protein